jgi:hypothetical protein
MFKEEWWQSSAEPHFKLSPTRIIFFYERAFLSLILAIFEERKK